MKSAYRIPDNDCATASRPARRRRQRFRSTSFNGALLHHQAWPSGAQGEGRRPSLLKGIAFDGGKGIKDVSVSVDGGATWLASQLGKDLGNYSFREWQLSVPLAAGSHDIKVRATNQSGQTQADKPIWNPAGYMRNVIETTSVTAA